MRSSFLRAGAIYGLANVASAAVPFLLLPVLTRVLGPAEYGSVVAFALLVSLCQTVAGLNAHAAMGVVWFHRAASEMPAFTATALATAAASTFLIALLVAVLLVVWPGLVTGIAPAWGALAALTAGANVIVQCRLVLWQSQHQPVASAALQFTASLANVTLSLVAVLLLGWGSSGRNAGIAVAALFTAVLSIFLFYRSDRLRWTPTAEHRRTLLRFGLPLIAHSLAGVLVATADRWSVSVQLDASALGTYGAAAQLGMVMAVLADAFVKAYSPWLYTRLRSADPDDRRVAVGAIYVALPAFLGLAVLLTLLLRAIGVWILGAEYRSALALLPWFMLGGAASGLYLSVSGLFFFSARTGLLAAVTVSAGFTGAALSWMLVARYGLAGAAAGYACTQTLLALGTALTAMRSFDLPWRHVGPSVAAWRRVSFGHQS